MNCGHGGHAGLTACDMKCCHDEGSTFVAVVIFVMPEQARISLQKIAVRVAEKAQAVISAILFEPPSPPPRSIVSIA